MWRVLGLTFLLFPVAVLAQALPSPTVRATLSATEVPVGHQVTLQVIIESTRALHAERIELPDLLGLQYISTIPRSSTHYTLTDGATKLTYRYEYTLRALEAGSFQIDPVYLQINEEEFATSPLIIHINPSDQERSVAAQTTPSRHGPVFLQMELSEHEPYRGQQIVAEAALYFLPGIDVSSYQVSRSWQTEGFWTEDLSQSETRRAETVILDGVAYRRAILSRYALFPARAGSLTLPPYEITAAIRLGSQADRHARSAFEGFGRQRDKKLRTDPLHILVRNLPETHSGDQFIHAIGQFQIERTLSEQTAKLGEAVDVITRITGTGNLALIIRPEYEYPDPFDTHSPREIIQRNAQAPRLSGTKEFRDVIIPRSTGEFELAETTLLAFNDITRRYEPHTLPSLLLSVVRDPNARVMLAESERFRLSPIRSTSQWTTGASPPLTARWWFWMALVLPASLLIYAYHKKAFYQKLEQDPVFRRSQQALDRALATLDQRPQVPSQKALSSVIYRSLTGYLTDRLGLSAGTHMHGHLIDALHALHVERPLLHRLDTLLQNCATQRFTPADADSYESATRTPVSEQLQEARRLLDELSRQL